MSRHAAVLLTYASRRSMRWFVLGGGVLFLLQVALLAIDPRETVYRAQSALFFTGFPAGIIGFLLVSQAKWQFVDSRARLLPQFARPHLAMLVVASVLGLLVAPCVAGFAARLNVLGAAACSIAMAASFVWAMHTSRMLPTLIGICTFYSLMAEAGRTFWLIPEAAAEVSLIHIAILAGGWISLAAWIARLARMTEEDDDYQIPIQAQSGSATRMERTQAGRTQGRMMSRNQLWRWPSDAWHDRIATLRDAALRPRRLLQYGFTPVPVQLNALWMAVIMVVVGSSSHWTSAAGESNIGSLAPFLFMACMFPAQLLAMRRSRMAYELVLPLSREQYLNGLLSAMARTSILSAAVLIAAAAVLVVCLGSELPKFPELAAYAAIGIAVQPYLFGMSIRSGVYASAIARTAVMFLAVFPAILAGSLGMWLVHQSHIPAALALAAVIAAGGAWVIRYARHVWLNAELA